MKKVLVVILVLAVVLAAVMVQPTESEGHRRSAVFVAAGPVFHGFPVSVGFTRFSRHSAFSVGFSGFWPGYHYPYYAAPVYYPAPVYYEPVYYERRYYRTPYDDRDWVKDAEEFLRRGR